MVYRINYKGSIKKDLKKLDKTTVRKLIDKLESVLSKDPNIGEPLKGKFKGLFKYRIGDYRVIYAKGDDFILVLRIRDRKEAYRHVN